MKKSKLLKTTHNELNNLETEFSVNLQYSGFPIPFSPYRLNCCMVCICIEGSADIEIDLIQYHFKKNDIFEIFPGQILATFSSSSDFSVTYFSFSYQMIDEVLYNLPADFIGYLKRSVKYALPKKEMREVLSQFMKPIYQIFFDQNNLCRREMLINVVKNFYLNLFNKVVFHNNIDFIRGESKRKKELLDIFFKHLKENPTVREVAFYARLMHITPKYLSIVTRETIGSSAKDLIDKFAITEIKLRLKTTSVPLKTIANSLNYPSEAFLCKFFKRKTLITPSDYRKEIHLVK
jgi:AraC family transcriptional regulator, transcriptional activator of pobA